MIWVSGYLPESDAVGHTHDTHLAAQFHWIAVAHSILVIAYHIIHRGTSYADLGVNYFDQRKADAVQNQLVKRLEHLGFKLTLASSSQAA